MILFASHHSDRHTTAHHLCPAKLAKPYFLLPICYERHSILNLILNFFRLDGAIGAVKKSTSCWCCFGRLDLIQNSKFKIFSGVNVHYLPLSMTQPSETQPSDSPTPATTSTEVSGTVPPSEPPPSFVKLAMRNMVKKGNKSLLHFGLTAIGVLGLLVGLAYLTR